MSQEVPFSVMNPIPPAPTGVTPAEPPPPPGQVETSLSQTEKPKASWIWMRDAAGYPSVSVTMLTVSFWVTTVLFILSHVERIGPVALRQFDVGAAGAYFGAILALYFGRRYTDAKYHVNR
jgi:hypothetical protein